MNAPLPVRPQASPAAGAATTPEQLVALRPALLRYARRRLREPAAAEDLVQATLLAALQGIGAFAGQSSPLTWVTGILKRKLVDHYRAAAREAPLPERIESDGGATDAPFDAAGCWQRPPGPWDEPEACLDQAEFLAVFEECLAGLPARSRQCFAMREVLGMEPEAICRELGITRGNYWVLMHRARLRLREAVERRWLRPAALR